MKPTYYIFDFDSTFTQVEAMEELAEISLANDPEKDLILEKIRQLTDLAMDGSMPFNKSLRARIALLSAKKYHVNMLVNRLRKRVSASFSRNKQFFKESKGRVIIVSGGFKEFIVPVVKPYFIEPEQVYANTFVFDKNNNIIGADEKNLLAQENGKVKLLKQLKLQGNIVIIGDGFTDYQVYEAGLAHKFFAYTENVSRKKVLERSEWIAPSLDEILFTQKLPMSVSYPKTRLKACLWGEETFLAEKSLKEEGYRLEKLPLIIGKEELNKHLSQSHLMLFSSDANLKLVQTKNSKLLCAGVWGEMSETSIAQKWAEQGIAVFGSNYAHTRSVSELALLMLLQLNRNLGEELHGKRLGIIGYGHSGSMLSVMCEHMGIDVSYYDVDEKPPIGNAKKVKHLPDLLRKSELLVLTAGKRFGGACLIGAKEIKQVQTGAILLSLSYDTSIDIPACLAAVDSGKLAGFGIDVLGKAKGIIWPKQGNVLCTFQNRLATRQTQTNIAQMLSEKVIDFVNTGSTRGSLNFPSLNLPELQQSHRFIHIHKNKPGVLAQINGILAAHKINISGQYLKTNEQLGYVITDVGKEYSPKALEDLKAVAETIKFRVLY
ncbi:MAG: 3-phosphoglycerate dehydrogenase [Bacteroidetes bacterium B1(2017)]|nr:MAG: 3-phosphoglycerate dehydrogenase [Bacteroidetes bacterium B1(2017)]